MVVFTYTQMGTFIEDWPHTTIQLSAQGKVMILLEWAALALHCWC